MKSKTFKINIGWCPDKVNADYLTELISEYTGAMVEVTEE